MALEHVVARSSDRLFEDEHVGEAKAAQQVLGGPVEAAGEQQLCGFIPIWMAGEIIFDRAREGEALRFVALRRDESERSALHLGEEQVDERRDPVAAAHGSRLEAR